MLQIASFQAHHNIWISFKRTQQICNKLRSAKAPPQNFFPQARVYIIPCSSSVGTTKRSIDTRILEHKCSCRLDHIEKSAENCNRHIIKFEEIDVLSTTLSYYQGYTEKPQKSTHIHIYTNRNQSQIKQDCYRYSHWSNQFYTSRKEKTQLLRSECLVQTDKFFKQTIFLYKRIIFLKFYRIITKLKLW